MEYLTLFGIVFIACSAFLLGMFTAYLLYRKSLSDIKNAWADKATISNLLRKELSKSAKNNGKSNGNKKKKYYRKNSRSQSSGKKL